MRKMFLATLLGLGVVFALTGCGENGKKTKELTMEEAAEIVNEYDAAHPKKDEPEEKKVEEKLSGELTLSLIDDGHVEDYEEIINRFSNEQGVKVNYTFLGKDEYESLINNGLSGGNLPDVFIINPDNSEEYMSKGLLLDITKQLATSEIIDLSKCYKGLEGTYNYDGNQYGIPKNINFVALWYNKAIFDKKGVSYPDANWSWEDFTRAAREVSDDNCWGYGIKHTDGRNGYYNAIYSMEGYVFDDELTKTGFDHPNTIQAMKMFTDLLIDGSCPSEESIGENTLLQLFSEGKIAMLMCGVDELKELEANEYVRNNCDVTLLPFGSTAEDRSVVYYGNAWVANANTTNPSAAYKLLEYLGSEEVAQQMAQKGMEIPAYVELADEWQVSDSVFNVASYKDMMAGNMIFVPYNGIAREWGELINTQFKDAWSLERLIEDVCVDIAFTVRESVAE